MRLRTRLTVALSVAMAATMATAFFAVSFVVTRSEEKQLDEALRAEARGEALEIARQSGTTLHLIGRPGPDDDATQLAKYAAIYDDETGAVVEASPDFKPPVYTAVKHPRGVPFDLRLPGESLRAVFAIVPGHPSVRLILAAPLTELERDRAYLRQVMTVAALASLVLIVAVIWPIVRGLTRDHEAIASTVRRVAAGDLRARVALKTGDRETARLAQDIDEMISRLSVLLDSQQRFVANAAHELRSPLTALYGELQLALRRPRDNEGHRAAISARPSTRRCA
ncbi:MAG: histidine kinase dimerization/phospho-acceptor domain-containing protein [Polyangiaceae bacterium]